MYMIPQNYQCLKCHALFQWSIDCDPLGFGEPYCPECFKEFISSKVPLGLGER